MIDEPAAPRRGRGAALVELSREDLELFAVEELQERIADLDAEIARCRAQIGKKRAGLNAAEALFGKKE